MNTNPQFDGSSPVRVHEYPVMFGYDGYRTKYGISPNHIKVWLSEIDYHSLTSIMTYRAVDDKDRFDADMNLKTIVVQERDSNRHESHRAWLSEESVMAVRTFLLNHASLGERMAIRHG